MIPVQTPCCLPHAVCFLITTENLENSHGEWHRGDGFHPGGANQCSRTSDSLLYHVHPHLSHQCFLKPGDDHIDPAGLPSTHPNVLFHH